MSPRTTAVTARVQKSKRKIFYAHFPVRAVNGFRFDYLNIGVNGCDSSVGVVTRLRGSSEFESHSSQTGSGTHFSSCFMATGELWVGLITHFRTVTRLRVSGVVPPVPLYAFMTGIRKLFLDGEAVILRFNLPLS